ncbi:MAG: hypothetical protein JWM62_3348, partial [Frankiales bacterium]|nr:hypothetical protein [Frankiales bacterium]
MTALTVRVGVVTAGLADGHADALRETLRRSRTVLLEGLDASADAVLVLTPQGVPRELEAALLEAAGRGTPVLLVGPLPGQVLADAAGLLPGRLLPV